jgi:taurine dioxygenase
MHIKAMAGALGADITGIDVARPLDAATFQAVHDAMVRYGVIVLRDQDLTPQQQLAFVERFGPIHLHPHVSGIPAVPQIMEVLKTEDEKNNFGAGWHTDQSYLETPAMATCLYALELPVAGGDTLFACMRNGYRSLSTGLQELALGLRTVNVSVAAQLARAGAQNAATFSSMRTRNAALDEPPAQHPLVRRHPVSAEPALYMGGIHTQGFVGFTEQESKPLMDVFMGQLTRPENTCRVRWTPGALALWDNRSVLHNAINDYHGQRRRMHRITVVGDQPIAYQANAAGRDDTAVGLQASA